MLDGVVEVGGGDEALEVHHGGADADGAALVVEEGYGFDVFGGPAVPVAGQAGVGGAGGYGVVHTEEVGGGALVFGGGHWGFSL